MLIVSLIIGLVALILASITDIQKREVNDYLSYSLIVIGLAAASIESIASHSFNPIKESGLGFLIGLAIGFGMFYLGQWGGGDSKLIMGLGAIIGFGKDQYWFLILLIGIIVLGSFYGILWSIYLAIKNRKEFIKKMNEWSSKKELKKARMAVLSMSVIILAAAYFFIKGQMMYLIFTLVITGILVFYMWIFIRIIEESCMIKKVNVTKLTEGDWIYSDIKIRGKTVVGPKDLGISKEQIIALKKSKIKTVIVKEGIPFVPGFLLAYITMLILYYTNMNLLYYLM